MIEMSVYAKSSTRAHMFSSCMHTHYDHVSANLHTQSIPGDKQNEINVCNAIEPGFAECLAEPKKRLVYNTQRKLENTGKTLERTDSRIFTDPP
jgi:hypothetical protein